MKEGLAALHAQSQSLSPSARAESQIRGRGGDSVASLSQASWLGRLARLRALVPVCAHVRAVITSRRRHYPSRRRHLLHHMEASTIPGRSHPGLGSAGSINAVPSAGRARHSSLGLVIPSAQASRASLALAAPPLPRATQKSQTLYSMPDPLRAMRAVSLDDTLTEAARSSAPSALCRRSCALGSPSRPHTPRMSTALRGGCSTAGPADSTDATRRSEETTEPACPQSSRNGAAAQQAW